MHHHANHPHNFYNTFTHNKNYDFTSQSDQLRSTTHSNCTNTLTKFYDPLLETVETLAPYESKNGWCNLKPTFDDELDNDEFTIIKKKYDRRSIIEVTSKRTNTENNTKQTKLKVTLPSIEINTRIFPKKNEDYGNKLENNLIEKKKGT